MATRGGGRRPTPIALRVVNSDRQDDKALEFPPDMPRPPKFLHAYALEEWNDQAPILYSMGVLTAQDRAALAGYCQAFARWRLAEELLATNAFDDKNGGLISTTEAGNKIQSVLLTVANGAMRDCLRFAAEFGMTPSARARIEGKRGEPTDPIASKYFKKG